MLQSLINSLQESSWCSYGPTVLTRVPSTLGKGEPYDERATGWCCTEWKSRFHLIDPWHTFHLGVGKTWVACGIMMIQALIAGGHIDQRIAALASGYKEFCKRKKLPAVLSKSTYGRSMELQTRLVLGTRLPLQRTGCSFWKNGVNNTLNKYNEMNAWGFLFFCSIRLLVYFSFVYYI